MAPKKPAKKKAPKKPAAKKAPPKKGGKKMPKGMPPGMPMKDTDNDGY